MHGRTAGPQRAAYGIADPYHQATVGGAAEQAGLDLRHHRTVWLLPTPSARSLK
ncbi:hypothetical protein GCM10009554_28930 [Kribbella koreensis]|uniref:Uncharacterized protein n=2 Tax=Kribbella TaxID=182639 RepID=A0ABP6YTD3_9ACTN